MRTSGVIYQYIDRPALPDEIIVNAHREEPADRILSDAFTIPVNRPVKIITPQKEEAAKKQRSVLSFTELHADTIREQLSNVFRITIGVAMLGVVFLITPLAYTELQFQLNPPKPQEEINLEQIEIVDSVVDTPTFTKLLNDKYVQKLNPINTDYALVIPKIGVNSPVIANVDPGNKQEYSTALKSGAAHAKGTSLPNEYGSKYIFAHSTDYFWNVANYNAVFYLLKDLEENDQIFLVYNGTLYPYKVSEKRVVNADDTFFLKPNMRDNRLILQTCWPPGTTWKRMLVFAEPMDTSLDSNELVSYSLDNSKTE